MTNDASKVVVVGAGRVGSTFAYTLAASGLVREIVVADADLARAEGEAMDIAQSVPFHRPVRVRAGSLRDAAGAAVTVITAGAAQRPGEPRTALVQRNVDVLRGILDEVGAANPGRVWHRLLPRSAVPAQGPALFQEGRRGLEHLRPCQRVVPRRLRGGGGRGR